MSKRLIVVMLTFMLSMQAFTKDIVLGIEAIPQRTMALIFTPIVLPDLITAKAALEFRVHKHFNLVIPVEAKWMDYRKAIRWGSQLFDGPSDVPEKWYTSDTMVRPKWNIDFSQLKISSGLGVKWFPFSEAMTNAFFLKTLMMAGFEHFNAFSADKEKAGMVFTHVFTIGYNWVKSNRFTFGFELGEEYTWHTNPIKNIPALISGFMPVLQFSLGFTI